jgi:hypothetical protein
MPARPSADLGRRVFLVHGRDHRARDALIALLRAFDLKVVQWRDAAAHAGGGTPYTGDIVAAGMELADVVVVLLTPDDTGYVRPAFQETTDGPHELQPTGQARLNVIFEAGMAMARDRRRVVLVELGQVRKMSDTDGLNVVRMHDSIERRKDLAQRLRSAGLSVDTDGEEWRTTGTFNRPSLTAVDLEASSPSIIRASAIDQKEGQLRVLHHIAEYFSRPDVRRLDTPFDVPGMTWDEIAVTLRDLADSDPPYITGISVEELDYPTVITGLTERGRKKANDITDYSNVGEGNATAASRGEPLPQVSTADRPVTDATASRLEEAKEHIKEIAESGFERESYVRSLIATLERDIRLNLRPPFSRKVSDDLSSLIRAILDYVVEDLVDRPAISERPVTAPVKLHRLRAEGEEILDAIEPYARLADHYDTEVAHRLNWSTNEVSRGLDELSNRAKTLKKRIVKYLQDLNMFLVN